jgi:hypothetical protein
MSEPANKKRKIEVSSSPSDNLQLICENHPLYINFPYNSTTPYWDPAWQRLEQSWSPSVQHAWERVPNTKLFWDNVFHAQSIDMSIFVISQALKLTKKACQARMTAGITVHKRSVSIPHWVFNRFIWARLLKEEKLQDVSSKVNVYKAQLTSLTRIAELFGKEHLVRGFSSGDRVIVAPRARILETWSPEGKQGLPEFLTVGAQKDEFVAVLKNFEDCVWAWIWRFRTNARCNILGLDVQGSYGLFPKSLLQIEDPVSIKFNDTNFKLTISL